MKKITTEDFVRNVVANTFRQKIDQDTLLNVAQKVDDAVATKAIRADKPKKAA